MKSWKKFENEDASSQNSFASPGPREEPYSETLLFKYGTSGTDLDTSQYLTKQTTGTLLSLYQYRVDPILKLLHWPSVIAAI